MTLGHRRSQKADRLAFGMDADAFLPMFPVRIKGKIKTYEQRPGPINRT
jgi:hypothetical protein